MTAVALLIAALAAGTAAQGGYYLAGRVLLTVLVGVALLTGRIRPSRPLWTVPIASAGLAAWILVRGLTGGGVALAVAGVVTLALFASATVIVGAARAEVRERYAEAVIGLAALVGLAAWYGVAARSPRFVVLVEHRLWRGAATLTYPNATAALLAPVALLALGRCLARPRLVVRLLLAYVVLVGLGATLSRAGFIAFAVGLVVLALLRQPVWRALPVVLGAAVAVGALAPSFPYGGQPRPLVALAGLVIGAVLAVGLAVLADHGRSVWVGVVLGTLAIAGPLAYGQLGAPYFGKILESRGNLSSSGRSEALASAVDLIERNPWTGVGVGQARFFVTGPGGRDAVALYAHNEYLQILVDLGVVGAVLLLILIAAVVRQLRRGGGPLWAGAVAALAAFAVHSGLDFLWHIAVLPLLAGLLTGLAATCPADSAVRPAVPSEEPINAMTQKEEQR